MDIPIPLWARSALEALEAAGYESYAVGGCVRDSLLGRTPHDWDVCTAAAPEQVEAVFAGERIIETGLRHGTVTLLREGHPLEITTFRTETGYSDGRHPDRVDFVRDVGEDLRRRDFTVNAMAWSPLRGLRDDFGGREDLRRGIIRCVGRPEDRFGEDALRILRALRFAARYGFTIEENTAAALRARAPDLKRIAPERIFAELKGLLIGPGAGGMLRAFPEVIFTVLPELAPCLGFDQRMPENHPYDVWGHITRAVDAAPPEELLRLTMLFHDAAKPAAFRWDEADRRARFPDHPRLSAALADRALRSLRCDNATRETVTLLVGYHDFRANGSRPAVRRALAALGEENMARLRLVTLADAAAHTPAAAARMRSRAAETQALLEEILAGDRCDRVEDLAVGGRDLMELGFSGPAVGKTLRRLLEEIWDEKRPNEREALLRRAREIKEESP